MRIIQNNDTRHQILELIKHKGPQDASALAGQLGISAMGVRQHLYALDRDGVVCFGERSGPVGRPAKLWRLTAAGERLFPDAHAELVAEILTAGRKALGAEGIDRLLDERARAQRKEYRRRIPPARDLDVRVDALARIRREEGYMAESRKNRDGSYSLVENHCSIRLAAEACAGLCERELELFRSILGAGVEVEREEHIINGDRRCAYRIRAGSASAAPAEPDGPGI